MATYRRPTLTQQQLAILPSLDRYLYSNLPIQEVIRKYIVDLRMYGKTTGNKLEMYHATFLEHYLGIIDHDSFVNDIQKDVEEYFLENVRQLKGFTCVLRGRIKSLFRLEAKFNDYVQDYIIHYLKEHGKNPSASQIIAHLDRYRDMIAFRFVLQDRGHNEAKEIESLIRIANKIPSYFNSESLDEDSIGGYDMLKASKLLQTESKNPSKLSMMAQPFYKDYVSNPKEFGFRAFFTAMRHNRSGQVVELQLETFDMYKQNEHGELSTHTKYEGVQASRRLSAMLPENVEDCYSRAFLEAHERIVRIENVDLTQVKVDMFGAFSQNNFADFCGLVVGRQAKPIEFL